jgi:hypothetical protein
LLVALTLLTFFTLLLPVAPELFVQTSTQRVEIVGHCRVRSRFSSPSSRRARALCSAACNRSETLLRLSFNRALVVTTSALPVPAALLLTAVQRTVSFTNAIGDTDHAPANPPRPFNCRAARCCPAAATHRTRGLFKILLQAD